MAAGTCDDAILLYRFLPADLEWGVQNLSETQVSHSSWLWQIRKGKLLIGEPTWLGSDSLGRVRDGEIHPWARAKGGWKPRWEESARWEETLWLSFCQLFHPIIIPRVWRSNSITAWPQGYLWGVCLPCFVQQHHQQSPHLERAFSLCKVTARTESQVTAWMNSLKTTLKMSNIMATVFCKMNTSMWNFLKGFYDVAQELLKISAPQRAMKEHKMEWLSRICHPPSILIFKGDNLTDFWSKCCSVLNRCTGKRRFCSLYIHCASVIGCLPEYPPAPPTSVGNFLSAISCFVSSSI